MSLTDAAPIAGIRKPLPAPSALSHPYWDAARKGELIVQRCRRCGQLQHPPRPLCTSCWSTDLDWHRCSGKGTVYSCTVAHRPSTPSFEGEAPYVVAIVELEEGVRLTSNVVGCAAADVHVGQRVEVVFEAVTEQITLVKFQPRSKAPRLQPLRTPHESPD